MTTTSTIFEITETPVIVKIPVAISTPLLAQDVEERLSSLGFHPLSSGDQETFAEILKPNPHDTALTSQHVAEQQASYPARRKT